MENTYVVRCELFSSRLLAAPQICCSEVWGTQLVYYRLYLHNNRHGTNYFEDSLLIDTCLKPFIGLGILSVFQNVLKRMITKKQSIN